MYDRPVSEVMQRSKVLKAAPETFVSEAATMMAANNAGAVMVVAGGRLVGICTERDIVFRVVAPGLDATVTRLSAVMTRAPHTIEPDKPFGYALVVMQEKGFRHLPVVRDGKPVGIVSSRGAMDPQLEEYVFEEHRRKHFAKNR